MTGSTPTRPHVISGVLLAAGQSRRMADRNKLLEPIEGVPMVRRLANALLGAHLHELVVVTGHDADGIRHALADHRVRCVHNPDFAAGMSTSLRAGIAALKPCDAAFVALGDMPWLSAKHVMTIRAAFDPASAAEICVPTHGNLRGHPVLWSARFFLEIFQLQGDVGARSLLERHAEFLREVPMPDAAVTLDADTPEALHELRRRAQR